MITVAAAGRLTEKSYRDLQAEYVKRMSRYASLRVTEVKDEPERAGVPPQVILDKEGKRLLGAVPLGARVVALTIGGKKHDSLSFARALQEWEEKGVCFIIGGSLGLSGEVLARANEEISLSDLTFPHSLARIVLLEQIYRACRINRNEPYHK